MNDPPTTTVTVTETFPDVVSQHNNTVLPREEESKALMVLPTEGILEQSWETLFTPWYVRDARNALGGKDNRHGKIPNTTLVPVTILALPSTPHNTKEPSSSTHPPLVQHLGQSPLSFCVKNTTTSHRHHPYHHDKPIMVPQQKDNITLSVCQFLPPLFFTDGMKEAFLCPFLLSP
jgi:hypothetical protein